MRSPPRPSGPPRAYGSPAEGAGTKASPRSPGVPPGAGEGGAGGRFLRRFRTKVGCVCAVWRGVATYVGHLVSSATCLPITVGVFYFSSGLWLRCMYVGISTKHVRLAFRPMALTSVDGQRLCRHSSRPDLLIVAAAGILQDGPVVGELTVQPGRGFSKTSVKIM